MSMNLKKTNRQDQGMDRLEHRLDASTLRGKRTPRQDNGDNPESVADRFCVILTAFMATRATRVTLTVDPAFQVFLSLGAHSHSQHIYQECAQSTCRGPIAAKFGH